MTKAVDKGFIESKDEAANIYARIMIYSVLSTMFFFPFFGSMTDKYPPFNLLFLSFSGRIISFLAFLPL